MLIFHEVSLKTRNALLDTITKLLRQTFEMSQSVFFSGFGELRRVTGGSCCSFFGGIRKIRRKINFTRKCPFFIKKIDYFQKHICPKLSSWAILGNIILFKATRDYQFKLASGNQMQP